MLLSKEKQMCLVNLFRKYSISWFKQIGQHVLNLKSINL